MSTRRKEESSSAARVAKESSPVKSKAESEAFLLDGLDPERLGLDIARVQSAIRPSFSDRENGAKGTLDGCFGAEMELVAEESGGPQPSGLNGTAPISKPTITLIQIRSY